MVNFAEAAINLGRQFLCRQISTTAGWAAATASATLRATGLPNRPSEASALAANAAGGLLNCPSDSGPYPALPSPPFTGGQCPTNYEVTVEYTGIFGGTPEGGTAIGTPEVGPIGEAFAVLPPTGGLQIWIPTGAGDVLLVGRGGFPGAWVDPEILSQSVVRLDGLPDDCGDLPSSTIGQDQPSDLVYDGPDGALVSLPVTVNVGGPIIEVNGAISFPVNIVGVGVLVNINYPGDGGPPEFGYPGRDPEAARCCPKPLPFMNPPDGDEEPPEQDPEGVIIGVFVVTTAIDFACSVTQKDIGDGPELDIPRLGTVHFGVNAGGALGWLNVIDIKNQRCFVPVPTGLGAIDAKVNPVTGVTFEVTRVYAAPAVILS